MNEDSYLLIETYQCMCCHSCKVSTTLIGKYKTKGDAEVQMKYFQERDKNENCDEYIDTTNQINYHILEIPATFSKVEKIEDTIKMIECEVRDKMKEYLDKIQGTVSTKKEEKMVYWGFVADVLGYEELDKLEDYSSRFSIDARKIFKSLIS